MIAAVDDSVLAIGWYYIPVVLLSSSLALGVALLVNNIQRRYPVFWFYPPLPPAAAAAAAAAAAKPIPNLGSVEPKRVPAPAIASQATSVSSTIEGEEVEAELEELALGSGREPILPV